MPVSPESLKERYDRLSLQLGPGVKAQLIALAKRAGVSPTQWISRAIVAAYAAEIGAPKKVKKDSSKG